AFHPAIESLIGYFGGAQLAPWAGQGQRILSMHNSGTLSSLGSLNRWGGLCNGWLRRSPDRSLPLFLIRRSNKQWPSRANKKYSSERNQLVAMPPIVTTVLGTELGARLLIRLKQQHHCRDGLLPLLVTLP